MKQSKKFNFGNEMAKILPVMLRAFARNQDAVCMHGNMTIPYIAVLDLLREKGPCRMSELAKALNFTLSAATGIIDKMIKDSLVKRERSREDRRVVRVALVKKGVEAAKNVNDCRRDMTNQMYSVLTQKERQEYLRLLSKVYDDLRKKL